jgi:hypothetical protein
MGDWADTARPVTRLWRVRRRRDHIDALLGGASGAWDLQFLRNDRRLVTWRFDTRDAARAEADARLRELERAGWTSHW